MHVMVVVEFPAQGQTVIPLGGGSDHVVANAGVRELPDRLRLRVVGIVGKLDIPPQILILVPKPLIILPIIGPISYIVLKIDFKVRPIWRWDALLKVKLLKVLLFPQSELDSELLEIDVTDGAQVDHALFDLGQFGA